MSNLLAAVGRGQLRTLDERVATRRVHRAAYAAALGDLPGIGFLPDDPRGRPTNWLTVITLDSRAGAPTPTELREHLDERDIEARPAWKPMHLQPLYKDAPVVGGAVAEALYAQGLCLPSGSGLTDGQRDRVIEAVRQLPWG
jgi:dTDP-4-amino-4,6-dideoxygalactose transaminase